VSLSANPVFEKVLLGDGYDQGFAFGRHGILHVGELVVSRG